VIISHSIRLASTETQEAYFFRAAGTARFTYNWALDAWKRQYEAGERPSGFALKKQFNAIRREQFPWTYDVHRDCTAQPFASLDKAFTAFFRKTAKYPKFKKRGQHDSFAVANDKFRLSGKQVKLPVLGWVKLRESLRFTGKIMGATVVRKAHAWFLSVQVDVGDYRKVRAANGIVGVDLGVKTSAVLSTGDFVQGPKALHRAQKRLRRLSRRHSRKVKGSSNKRKTSQLLARLHFRVANTRSDFLHKLSTKLCRENQTVVIEDLYVKGMVRTRKLAKSISDEGWGELRRQLEYKSRIYGTNVIVADRWFPSSKLCSFCGARKADLKLSDRTYSCEQCGAVIDRDWNAARNLEQLGTVSPEVTPADIGALVSLTGNETLVDEAGTICGHLCSQKG